MLIFNFLSIHTFLVLRPLGSRQVSNNHLRAFHHLLHFLLPSFVGVYSTAIKFLVVNLTELVMLWYQIDKTRSKFHFEIHVEPCVCSRPCIGLDICFRVFPLCGFFLFLLGWGLVPIQCNPFHFRACLRISNGYGRKKNDFHSWLPLRLLVIKNEKNKWGPPQNP